MNASQLISDSVIIIPLGLGNLGNLKSDLVVLIVLNIFASDVSLQKESLGSFFDLFHELSLSLFDFGVERGLELMCLEVLDNVESSILSSTLDQVELIRECFSISVLFGEIYESFLKGITNHGLRWEVLLVMQDLVVGGDLSEKIL